MKYFDIPLEKAIAVGTLKTSINIYELDTNNGSIALFASKKSGDLTTISGSRQLIHERLSHPSSRRVQELVTAGFAEITGKDSSPLFDCVGCARGGIKKRPFLASSRIEVAKEPGEGVHGDMCGPLRVTIGKQSTPYSSSTLFHPT